MRTAFLPLLSLLFFSARASEKTSPVYLDNLPKSGNVHLLFNKDTLANCDPDSRVRKIVQDTLPVKQRNDALFFPVLKADSAAIQQLTFLNRSGDSLFFMATVRPDSSTRFYTSLCVDRKNVLRFSVEGGSPENAEKPMHHDGGMGGMHHGGGMGGMR